MLTTFFFWLLGSLAITLGAVQILINANTNQILLLPENPWLWVTPFALAVIGVCCVLKASEGYFRNEHFAAGLVGLISFLLAIALVFARIETIEVFQGFLSLIVPVLLFVGGIITTRVRI